MILDGFLTGRCRLRPCLVSFDEPKNLTRKPNWERGLHKKN
jgi:hypothetical protein